MKKRILMIFIIILVMLLIPRCNKCGNRSKINHGHRFPNRKTGRESDEFDLFPGKWLLSIMTCNRIRQYIAPHNTFIPAGYNHNNYQPTQST